MTSIEEEHPPFLPAAKPGDRPLLPDPLRSVGIEPAMPTLSPTRLVDKQPCPLDWVREGCRSGGQLCRAADQMAPASVGQQCQRYLASGTRGSINHAEDVDFSVCNEKPVREAFEASLQPFSAQQIACTLPQLDQAIARECDHCVRKTYVCLRGDQTSPFRDGHGATCMRVPNDSEDVRKNLEERFGRKVAALPHLYSSLSACERACDRHSAYPPRQ